MTDHEGKAREIAHEIIEGLYTASHASEITPIVSAIVTTSLEAESLADGEAVVELVRKLFIDVVKKLNDEKLEEREACAAICDAYAEDAQGHTEEENAARKLAMSENDKHLKYQLEQNSIQAGTGSIGLTGIAAVEAEMRDRLAAKDATIQDLSRKLEEARHRIAELESATGGREMWAIWNSCNGVFEVTSWRRDALNIIEEAYSEHETVVPVRVFVEDEDRHWLCHQREDEREAMWKSRPDPETATEAPSAPETPGAITHHKDG